MERTSKNTSISQIEFLIEEVKKKKKLIDETNQTHNEVAYLQLCVHVGLLFNDLLLNSSNNVVGITKIHRDNVQQIETDLKKMCKYFFKRQVDWRKKKV